MRWAGNVARTGERRGAYRILVGKPEGKRPLVRCRRRLNQNESSRCRIGCMNWIDVAQVTKLPGYIKYGEFLDKV